MTIKNILAGFRVTGIYPLDRKKLTGLGETEGTNDSEKAARPFNPLLSVFSTPKRTQKVTAFFNEDFESFHDQYTSHDDDDDERHEQFDQWKQMYRKYDGISLTHNENSPLDLTLMHTPAKTDSKVLMVHPSRPLQSVLKYPSPIAKPVPHKQVTSGRILTSIQNLEIMEEKERMKEEKQRLKDERMKKRKEKAQKKDGI